jgi:curved DNA-binding protein
VKDLYASLGVPKTASADDLKKAYRKLTRMFHPDRNPGNKKAEERFKEVGNAYEVLSDPERRALYDEFGELSLSQGFDADRARRYQRARAGAGQGAGGVGLDEDELLDIGDARSSSFEDLLSRMFGGRRGGAEQVRRGARAGIDISGEIHVTLLDALRGTTVPVRVEVSDGDTRTMNVKVPPGIPNGGTLRLRGQGGSGDPPGDLRLDVIVDRHPRLSREGNDLRLSVPVTAYEAYRGGPIDVRTPWGTVALKLPAGAQNGQVLRVRGHGVRPTDKPHGDLFVVLDIRMPPAGNAKLLEALAQVQAADDPREGNPL